MAQTESQNESDENRVDETNEIEEQVNAQSEDVESRNPDDLTPHPRNEDIYDDGANDSLVASIEENGIRVPVIVVSESHFVDDTTEVIISGHRRVDAAQKLDIDEVPTIIRPPYDSELDEREAIVDHNEQREKTFSQKMREAKELIAIERERAKKRQQRGKAIDDEGGPQDFEKGETYEIVAEQVFNRSRQWLYDAVEVWDAQEDEQEAVSNRAKTLVNKIERGELAVTKARKELDNYRKTVEQRPSATPQSGQHAAQKADDPVQATVVVSNDKLQRLFEVSTLRPLGEYTWLYLEITADGVRTLDSAYNGGAYTYCNFHDAYFEELKVHGEGSLKTFIETGSTVSWLGLDGADTVRMNFHGVSNEEFISEITFVGEREYHLPDVTDPIIGGENPLDEVLKNLPDRFDDSERLKSQDGTPVPTRIETEVNEVKKLMWAVDHTPGDGNYPLTIEDNEFRFHTGDNTSYLKGLLNADVTGSDINKTFDMKFKHVFDSLSGEVELQTAPADEAPLAAVQRKGDHVIRHVIAPA